MPAESRGTPKSLCTSEKRDDMLCRITTFDAIRYGCYASKLAVTRLQVNQALRLHIPLMKLSACHED